jgi:uncharacterized protein YlxW (UPF0749 family)
MVAQARPTISGIPERARKPPGEPHEVDAAGQAILSILQKATNSTEENNRRAAEIAEKLLHHLRVAEDRIASLQSEVRLYREKSDRAERWLRRISDEIEHCFNQRPIGHPEV